MRFRSDQSPFNFSKVLNILFAMAFFGSFSMVEASTVEIVGKQRCATMMSNQVISDSSPVGCNRLRLVKFQYINFEGRVIKDGEIIVIDAVAQHVSRIFDELLSRSFPLNQARPMEHYLGSDDESMADNNTSSFMDRKIVGASKKSLHAYGAAIDLNPLMNPFIATDWNSNGLAKFKPPNSLKYTNRAKYRFRKPVRKGFSEDVVDVFASHGFLYWGGDWDNPIDYQHFQLSREVAEFLASTESPIAELFFNRYTHYYNACWERRPNAYLKRSLSDYSHYLKQIFEGESLVKIYIENPQEFVTQLNNPEIPEGACTALAIDKGVQKNLESKKGSFEALFSNKVEEPW